MKSSASMPNLISFATNNAYRSATGSVEPGTGFTTTKLAAYPSIIFDPLATRKSKIRANRTSTAGTVFAENNTGEATPEPRQRTSAISHDEIVRYRNSVLDPIARRILTDQVNHASPSAERMTATDRILNFRDTGTIPYANRGVANRAARALNGKKKVVICIGANSRSQNGHVSPLMQGVRGALILGMSSRDVGSSVTYVADAGTADIIKNMLNAANVRESELHGHIDVRTFCSNHEVNGAQKNASAKAEALEIINKTQADAVVTIELPDALDESGNRFTESNADLTGAIDKPIYEVARAAASKNILIVAIGNGDTKKVGFGTTQVTLPVQGNVSNITATAIGAFLMKLHGKLDFFIAPDHFEKIINSSFDQRFQARSRSTADFGSAFSSKAGNTDFQKMYGDLNKNMLTLVKDMVEVHEIVPTSLNEPTELAIFDSSNGAFIAATVLKSEFEKLGYATNFIIVVDHGHAPYGKYAGESEGELYRLVSSGLKTCQVRGAALVGMACNTACIVPAAQNNISIPVVDLINVTAEAIARDGGARPVLISTVATTQSTAYPAAVLKASGNTIDLRKTRTPKCASECDVDYMIGAPTWADVINKLGANVNKPESDTVVCKIIKEVIDKVPADATSVWLTCTHYPVFLDRIKAALLERNMDIKIINPMVYQAKAIAAQIAKLEVSDTSKLGKNILKGKDVVISSARTEDLDLIKASVKGLFRETRTEIEHWKVDP